MTVTLAGFARASALARLRNDAGPDATRPMGAAPPHRRCASGKLPNGPKYSLCNAGRSGLSVLGIDDRQFERPGPILAGSVSIVGCTGTGIGIGSGSSGGSGIATGVCAGCFASGGFWGSTFTGGLPPKSSANASTSTNTPTDAAVAYIQIGEPIGPVFAGFSSSG